MMGSTLVPPDPPTSIPVEEIKVPLSIARGQYEKTLTKDLVDHLQDITAEVNRRLENAGRSA